MKPAKKILVTGGTGFIGSHTVVELMKAGYEVIIIDNLSNSDIKVVGQIEKIMGKRPAFYNLDLCEEKILRDFITEHSDISGVIHFAAFKAVGESVENPLRYYRNNLYSLINLLIGYISQPIHFVFSSSCTVYGQPRKLPVTEKESVKQAKSPYGNTKQISEDILKWSTKTNPNLHVVSLRYFNPVGAHESAMLGELPIGLPQNLIPFITQTAIGKRKEIIVHGNDYDTPDGTCIRDYIHVVDLARAHVAALNLLENHPSTKRYRVYNIGTGKGNSVLEVIRTFESATGVKLDYQVGPRRSGDVEQIYGEVSKAEKELGWKAELDLTEMMRSSWEWEKYIHENPFEK